MICNLKSIRFFIVVFISNVIQCITGFAGTVLAMPFSIMLIGMLIGFCVIHFFSVSPDILYRVLGVIVIIFTVSGCVRTFKKSGEEKTELKRKSQSI